jgi:hypothetical protein
MRGQIKITTGFPSAAKAARNLGVSKRVARDLSLLAERSLKTGEFVLPGVSQLVGVGGRTYIRRAAKAAKGATAPAKK